MPVPCCTAVGKVARAFRRRCGRAAGWVLADNVNRLQPTTQPPSVAIPTLYSAPALLATLQALSTLFIIA